MNLLTPILIFLFICVRIITSVENNSTSKNSNLTANFSLCEKCISKCCHFGEYVAKKKCRPYNEDLNLPVYPVYTESIENTGKVLKDYFTIIPGKFDDEEFKSGSFNMYRSGFRHYVTENGTLYLDLPNAYKRWTLVPPRNYCIDYQLPNKYLKTPQVRVWVSLEKGEMSEATDLMTSAMIVTCVFLVIVLIVYSMLPELRNLCGMILMAYVASLLSSFIFLIAMQKLAYIDKTSCMGLTAPLYFSLMASFCWMNIMSCDVWWTFRGYAKARPIHRRGERVKFCMYCLYAWGIPLCMTVFLVVVNSIDLTDIPWFITPMIPTKGCFLEQGQKLVYMYIPMLIMCILNWAFYLMTAFNIWRLSRGTAFLDSAAAGSPAAHRSHFYRFLVYLKLSVLMGLNWIVEVVSSFNPNLKVWYFFDACNLLIGFFIFLVFVCKKKIYNKLVKKASYSIARNKAQQRWTPYTKSRSTSTTDSNISQETPLQVCANPKGTYLN